ncbi:hypothetical protein HNY73_022244 [Argiope bruennichi]|uniref:Uncharacterized protein n=1 Tax=Argiope bruennichi TaxID=94029 RepID=A0A8T0E3V5_ARGBR|nr:hypothetical protein HNY73_022244 [Argiope bruennichi]
MEHNERDSAFAFKRLKWWGFNAFFFIVMFQIAFGKEDIPVLNPMSFHLFSFRISTFRLQAHNYAIFHWSSDGSGK